MSVVKIIDDVTEWAQSEICNRVKLKEPPPNDAAAVDQGYQYKTVTPQAFSLFVPAKDKLPPGIVSPVPSLCVRVVEGQDTLDGRGGSIVLQFVFSTWDVGTHGLDLFDRQKDGSYKRWSGQEAADYFCANADGWRDAWNFVDTALRELESHTDVAGYELDRQSPIEYGPLADQDGIPDYFPFWFCWVQFTLKYTLIRNIEKVEEYL